MVINISKEVREHSLMGLLVVNGLSTAAITTLAENSRRETNQGNDIMADISITVNGYEVDVRKFVDI